MCPKVFLKEIKCPSHCACDIFENYRRANCQNRSLIGVEADIPPQVQLLELSGNLIYELYDHIFDELQLTELLLLNVSRNKINSIHIQAFAKLDRLKTLDLSYNNLEYVLRNWFWNTPSLQELYLRGNNLRRLDEPIAESSSIQILDISACSLLYVHDDAFSQLPQLEIVDLSENYLLQLRVDIFKPCPNLNRINIESNNLSCNNILDGLLEYCRDNEIAIFNPCIKTKTSTQNKFEKIITAVEDSGRNSWIYDEVPTKTEIPTMCNCRTQSRKGILFDIFQRLPILVLVTTFCVGLGLGLVIACSINIKKPKKTRKRKIRRTRPMSDIYIALTNAYEVSETTPMPTRRDITR
ncbi:hypothetical protein RN001_015665 [Aquatica leii]|uniref:Uncharacterized protein n=1 Tax=Aquatica leii TaxID=1421715 RepID=A0AAN7NYC2_9COLE|nr:hypothetical protein RN001_015665 [Aquatica leii]